MDRQNKKNICTLIGGSVGVAAGITFGIDAAEALNSYVQWSDAASYLVTGISSLVCGAGLGLFGFVSGIASGEVLYNKPVKLKFEKPDVENTYNEKR